jgi:hypothetical protein
MSTARLERDGEIVRRKLPKNTRLLSAGGVDGWVYEITCEFGRPYTMFLFWDGSLYKARLMYPDPGQLPNDVHTHHYLRNGVICLTKSIGYPRLEDAYAKSILFATAWTTLQETGSFDF